MKKIINAIVETTRDIAAMFRGYKPTSKQKNIIIRLLISAFLFVVGLFFGKILAASLVIYLASYVICAYDVLIDAGKRILNKNFFDEKTLMSVASIGAFAIGEFTEGAAVMILYQLGELFQSIAVNRSRRSIKSMMELRPDIAHKYVDGKVQDVSTDELVCGDICVVRPGERVPIDGIIVDGVLEADASAITGESLPVTLKEGSHVISGYISLSSVVRIKATTSDADSTVTRILKIVEEQSENKAEREKLVTKFARYYTPAIFAITLIIGVIVPIFAGNFREWIYRGHTGCSERRKSTGCFLSGGKLYRRKSTAGKANGSGGAYGWKSYHAPSGYVGNFGKRKFCTGTGGAGVGIPADNRKGNAEILPSASGKIQHGEPEAGRRTGIHHAVLEPGLCRLAGNRTAITGRCIESSEPEDSSRRHRIASFHLRH